MGIQFEVDVRPDYVCLSCTGVFCIEDFLHVFDKGFSIAADKKLSAILVDIRGLKGCMATMQRFNIGEAVPKIQRKYPPVIGIAIVGDEPMVDPERFGETVAVNRGAAGKVFTDIDEARTWLNDWVKARGC